MMPPSSSKRPLPLRRKVQGDDHPATAHSLNRLGHFYVKMRRFTDAEKSYRESLAIEEKALGREHPDAGNSLLNLAWLNASQGRLAEALPLAERTIPIFDHSGAGPWTRHKCYFLRAQILWGLNRKDEAVADIRQALDLAEQQRGLAGGSEYERSEVFGQFTNAYETMVAWQTERGDVEEAFAAIERSRARSLLDEMAVSGADLERRAATRAARRTSPARGRVEDRHRQPAAATQPGGQRPGRRSPPA